MRLNINSFKALTKEFPKSVLCQKLELSRTQLWRGLAGKKTGIKFLSGFKKAFPNEKPENYFFYD